MKRSDSAIKTITITVTAIVALSTCFLAGCMSFNPRSLRTMERSLIESNPGLDIKATMKFGLGALTMDFVDFAFVHDSRIDLSKISRAEVAVYELGSTLVIKDFTMPQQVTADRSCPRPEIIMRMREDDEYTQVVVCIRDEKVTGLAVFTLERDEITVMNVRGNFESIVNSLVKYSMKKKSDESEAQASVSHSRSATVANEDKKRKRPRS